MKKINLFLCAAVCAAGFAFLSCGEKEVWTTVENFAPDAGTYAGKIVGTSSQTQGTSGVAMKVISDSSMTLVIEGTEDSSNVQLNDVSYTIKSIMECSSETVYDLAKKAITNTENYTFDDNNLTITYKTTSAEEDSNQTYSKFCSSIEEDDFTIESSSFGNWKLTLDETEDDGTTTNTTITLTLK